MASQGAAGVGFNNDDEAPVIARRRLPVNTAPVAPPPAIKKAVTVRNPRNNASRRNKENANTSDDILKSAYSNAKQRFIPGQTLTIRKSDYDMFLQGAAEIYKKGLARASQPGRILPNLMKDVDVLKEVGDDEVLLEKLKEVYAETRKVMPFLSEKIPAKLPHHLGTQLLADAKLHKQMDTEANTMAFRPNVQPSRRNQQNNMRARLFSAPRTFEEQAAAATTERQGVRRRGATEMAKPEPPVEEAPISPVGDVPVPVPVPVAPPRPRAPPPRPTPARPLPSIEGSPMRQTPMQTQTQKQIKRGREVDQAMGDVAGEMKQLGKQAQEIAAAQSVEAALAREAAAMNAKNAAIQQAAIAARLEKTAHIAAMTRNIAAEGLSVGYTLQNMSSKLLEKADEAIGLTTAIQQGQLKMQADLTHIRTNMATKEGRGQLLREMVDNEFIMFFVFLCMHTQTPIMAESIGSGWMLWLGVRRANQQALSFVRAPMSHASIAGVVNLVTPWALFATFFTYNNRMAQARLNHDPEYERQFANTAESAIYYAYNNWNETEQRVRTFATGVRLPTTEELTAVMKRAMDELGAGARRQLAALEAIDPNWKDPGVFVGVLCKYMLGGVEFALEGATHVLQNNAFAYQIMHVRGSATEVFATIMWALTSLLGQLTKTVLKWGGCVIWRAFCTAVTYFKAEPSGWGASVNPFSYIPSYQTCAGVCDAKEHQDGGGPSDQIVLYTSPEAEEFSKALDQLTWSLILLEINAGLYPKNRRENMAILKRMYMAAGNCYALTLFPELGFEQMNYSPIVDGPSSSMLLLSNAPNRNNTSKRNKRGNRNKTSRNGV